MRHDGKHTTERTDPWRVRAEKESPVEHGHHLFGQPAYQWRTVLTPEGTPLYRETTRTLCISDVLGEWPLIPVSSATLKQAKLMRSRGAALDAEIRIPGPLRPVREHVLVGRYADFCTEDVRAGGHWNRSKGDPGLFLPCTPAYPHTTRHCRCDYCLGRVRVDRARTRDACIAVAKEANSALWEP